MNNIMILLTVSGFLLGNPVSVPASASMPLTAADMSHPRGQAFSHDGAVLVRVPEHASPEARKRVMVQSGIDRQYYTLPSSFRSGEFPLKDGNGTYTVTLYQYEGGSSYKELSKQVIELHLKDKNAVYLRSIQPIHWNGQMSAIQKALELTYKATSPTEKTELIYTYLAQRFSYDYEKARSNLSPDYTPDVEATFLASKGICYDASATFAAMLRSVGVPAKLVKGYAPDVGEFHAWNEVYIEGKGWVTMDLTFDAPYVQAGRTVEKWKDGSRYRPEASF
ncbi:Transglutaminase-like superfamily protein [Paenibacillus sp. UNCCL117]|uniref:transglutaminase-like domain-containing protein n=1 Tax=unclassified Paenibacillus TaxID=185978 RepID=UPI00088F0F5F|nr:MULTISPECIES: transglutaminase-like domain-containing protein [unclassified Paenibacillus]SDD02343.1 Transglutaminase-like superfamily protein [Paenibacillus sp. cl123]SFW32507.1 Transglutaminase-like superfamily protein [Paenibacillus sp. UNCCL117]